MKKFITILLSFTLAISMTACGDGPESSQKIHHPQKPSSHQSEDEDLWDEEDLDVEEDEEESETADQNTEENEEDMEDNSTTTSEPVTGTSFDLSNGIPESGILIADHEDFSILITGIEEDGYLGYTLNTRITNKSDTLSYHFTSNQVDINGVSSSAIMFDETEPGESVDSTICFSEAFQWSDTIGDISQIDLVVSAQDAEFNNDPIYTDVITLYPHGESNVSLYEYKPEEGHIPVFENDDFKMVLTNTKYEDFWGYSAVFYIENKTDSEIMLDCDDAVVNGNSIDIFFSSILQPHKKTFSPMSFYSEDLEKAGITSVSDIQMHLIVQSLDDYDTPLIDETVSIQPEPFSW